MKPKEKPLPKINGRPKGSETKYRRDYPDLLVSFFDVPLTRKVLKRLVTKPDGTSQEEFDEVASELPMLQDFAVRVDVSPGTLSKWANTHLKFKLAMEKAAWLQERILVQNSVAGRYNAQFSMFYAKNKLGYKDKTEQNINIVSVDSMIAEAEQRIKIKAEKNVPKLLKQPNFITKVAEELAKDELRERLLNNEHAKRFPHYKEPPQVKPMK